MTLSLFINNLLLRILATVHVTVTTLLLKILLILHSNTPKWISTVLPDKRLVNWLMLLDKRLILERIIGQGLAVVLNSKWLVVVLRGFIIALYSLVPGVIVMFRLPLHSLLHLTGYCLINVAVLLGYLLESAVVSRSLALKFTALRDSLIR